MTDAFASMNGLTENRMILLFPILFVAGITALACHLCSRRRVRPSIWVAVISTFVGSAIVALALCLMERGPIWERDFKTGLYPFPTYMEISALLTFLPAEIVVFLYQRKTRR